MVIIVMGPTGSGKTTVGSLLAQRLNWTFVDADDFHSAANKEKMRRGIPLTDADRMPWLAVIHQQIERWLAEKRNVALACSALKQEYRDALGTGLEVRVVYLKGSYDLIYRRLLQRKGHFADQHILAGQFADLEEPKDGITIEISRSPEEIVDEICARLSLACRKDA